MSDQLKPYDEYKEVDLLWINSVPSHWEIVSNKALWAERNIRNCIDEELLSVTIKQGVIRQKEFLRNSIKKDVSNQDKSNYKLVIHNDIAYNKMRMWQGAVGKSRYRGIVSPAYIVLQARRELNPDYFNYLLRTPEYIEESHRYSYGICDDQLNLRYEDFKRMKNIFPPLDEQEQIIRYLDFKLAKINKFIKTKKKLIKVLNEQKQAMINEAVTKGTNPYVKMKPSGIDWLGDIPEHWIVTGLKRLFIYMTYGISENSTNAGIIPVLTMGDINDGEVIIPKSGGVMNVDDNLLLKRGDLLFNRTNSIDLVGKVGIYRDDSNKQVTFASYLVRLRAKKDYCSEYINYLLNSSSFITYARSHAYKSINQANLNPTRYGYLLLAYPDELSEQRQITNYINKKIEIINASINNLEREILLMNEYRTRLISDVVTGKVDVRGIEIGDIVEDEIDNFDEVDIDDMNDEEIDNFEESEV